MALRDDIRKAIGSIASTLPDATHIMRHGEAEVGQVVQSSSREFASTVTEDAPVVAARFIANAGIFPTMDEGEAVELDGTLRVVVECKADPVGATFTLGLSAPFDKAQLSYTGQRRTDGATRTVIAAINALFLEDGTADTYANAFAPSYARSYTIAIRREDWTETSDPEPSDTLELAPDGIVGITVKVSSVTRHDGWYILKCRAKE